MTIQIRQTYGQIGIDTYRSWMDIKQTPPKAHIEQRPPELNIDRKLPKVHIDQTQCFIESGRKPALQMAKDFYDEGLEAAYEAIGMIAEEGTRMAAIEYGGNPIADIAYEVGHKEYDFNAVQMPQSKPQIEWDLGYLNLDWKPNPAKIDWETHSKAYIDASHHRVDIYMKTWPKVEIEYRGKEFDMTI